MYEHARCIIHLGPLGNLRHGQERGLLSRHQNLPTAKSRCFVWQRLLSKKNGPIWNVSEAAVNIFLLEIHSELRHCEFIVTLTAICKATWFQQFFKKCDNLLPIYKDSSNHLQDWINLIWSDLCITVTWHLAGLLRPTYRNHRHGDQGENGVNLTSKVLSSVTTTIICPKEKDF